MGALTIGLGAVVAFAGATTSLPTTGDGITPTYVEGSNIFANCVAAPTGQSHIFGLKVQPGDSVSDYDGTFNQGNSDGTHEPNNPLQVTIENAQVNGDGVATFDWSANMPVDYVFVKAGSAANKYDYSGYGWGGNPATGPWSDTGLVSPKDSISHILFCTVKKLRVEKTAVAGFAREYQWTITKKVRTTGNDYASSASLSLPNGNSGDAHWQIIADQTGTTDSGFNVGGVITVLNSSPFDVAGVVDESLSNVAFGGACTAKDGTNDRANVSVGKGATATCTYSAPLASKTDGTNSVEVDPTTPDWMSTTSASKAYTFGNPTSEKNKTVRWSDSNGQASTGITGDRTTTYDTSHSCPESRTVTNIATLYGDANANLGSSTATVGITCTPPQKLTISKTANGTFDRSWTWTVDKQVKTDGTFGESASLGLPAGGSGSAHYKVTVGATSADGPFTVSGTITIGNPNATAVSGVSVTDAIAGATIDCLPDDGNQSTGLTIAGNGSLNCSYTVTKADKPLTNTASVTATNSLYNNTSAPATVVYSSTPANETGTSVVARDVFDGAAAETLGTVTTGDLSNGTKQFTYDRTLSCGNTHTYDNTASIYANAESQQALASDSARVDVTCASPVALTVTKTANPSFTRTWDWQVEKTADQTQFALKDGGTASTNWNVKLIKGEPVDSDWSLDGTITVSNPNGFAVEGVSVSDGLGGTVECPATTIAANGSLPCTYAVGLEGGDEGTNTATATTTTQGVGSGSGQASYAFTNPTKKVNESVDVADTKGKTWDDQDEGFTTSYGTGTLPCANANYSNTVRVFGDEGKQLDEATATITTTCSSTTVNRPTPKIDIGVTKSATTPTVLGGTVTYSIVVSSIGQDPAVNVTVADPAPDGIAYTSATASDAAVSCTVTPALVTCSRPGSFDPGQSFVVTVKATASKLGTLTNTVTVTNEKAETTNTNNEASATTLVIAPLKPPVKPKPPLKPTICATLVVGQKTVMVGKKSKLTFAVTAAGKPVKGAKIKIKGPGLNKTVVTAGNGKASATVRLQKAGIVTIAIAGKKSCNTARVGVIGAFEPPVTG